MKLVRLVLIVLILMGLFLLGVILDSRGAFGGGLPLSIALRVRDYGTYLAYVPAGLPGDQKVPLVFALSPSADARGMIGKWAGVVERRGWILLASKTFQNGLDFMPLMTQLNKDLDDAERRYAVDPRRVIFTGLSGGGMGSHGFVKYFPDRVAAIVINTGMASTGSLTANYPTGKLAVFLASPTDFRYNEMKSDRAFLEGHGWKVKWIEFEGGHTLAPDEVYQQAADWLGQNLP